jgi:hypothetical protein
MKKGEDVALDWDVSNSTWLRRLSVRQRTHSDFALVSFALSFSPILAFFEVVFELIE